jgi:hypothetical protein
MPFQFVDNAAIDDKARKLIRSHVAKGKNVGKGRARKKPHPTQEQQPPRDSRDTTTLLECVDTAENDELALERPWCDGVSLMSIPFEMSSKSKNLFSRGDNYREPPVHDTEC